MLKLNLEEFQTHFQQYLENQLSNQHSNLYLPIQYILDLGGKRIRPYLVYLGHSIFNASFTKPLPQAFAIELFHNFTLLHDDIMDDASLRRGKPTAHEIFGRNNAILSGDTMLILAYQYLSEGIQNTNFSKILEVFNKMALSLCEGQQKDMDFESQDTVELSEYIEMISNKTSVLLGCALEVGALSAGANYQDAQNLYAIGLDLGIAFQIQDDILDTFGDNELFGKKKGGDILQKKKTILTTILLSKMDAEEQKSYHNYYASLEKEVLIETITDLYLKNNILQEAEQLKEQYHSEAIKGIKQLSVKNDAVNHLYELAESMIQRKF